MNRRAGSKEGNNPGAIYSALPTDITVICTVVVIITLTLSAHFWQKQGREIVTSKASLVCCYSASSHSQCIQ